MPTIEVNPHLWTVGRVRLDDDSYLDRGDTLEVSDEEWEELKDQKVTQFSRRYRTFVIAGQRDDGERLAVRLENLDDLTVRELRAIASEAELKIGGNKDELVERITAHYRSDE